MTAAFEIEGQQLTLLPQDRDPAQRNRVMQALLTMVKPDIVRLQEAADGRA